MPACCSTVHYFVSIAELPLRTKGIIACMESRRFTEELALIKLEMANFLKFYKKIISDMQQQCLQMSTKGGKSYSVTEMREEIICHLFII